MRSETLSPDAGSKVCPDCQQDKPLSDFYLTKYGKPYKRCKRCQVAFLKVYRNERGGNAKRGTYYRDKWKNDDTFWLRMQIRQLTDKCIRRGIITPGPCSAIGSECEGRIEAHHDDYGRPFEIRWLCQRHHRLEDAPKVGRIGEAA